MAALRAMPERSSADSLSARARPPFNPPLLANLIVGEVAFSFSGCRALLRYLSLHPSELGKPVRIAGTLGGMGHHQATSEMA